MIPGGTLAINQGMCKAKSGVPAHTKHRAFLLGILGKFSVVVGSGLVCETPILVGSALRRPVSVHHVRYMIRPSCTDSLELWYWESGFIYAMELFHSF